MEGSISSDDCGDDPDFVLICFCGEPAPLIKSRTPKNPGRRFFGCTKYLETVVGSFAGMSLLLGKQGVIWGQLGFRQKQMLLGLLNNGRVQTKTRR
ncbi:hypothetical protein RHSIM_Rhsim05G0224100 [Rhododendron simsii]|uniref:Zinc finger GRF-type domain-containing protein n=1 Tax=Rhododendron simsii TaxID=118357 RepID=A0A834GXZ3_RHOSS|nr:hypothetical protein RHSIM_Rhsim05G0224100 [Rhododendron simsii]